MRHADCVSIWEDLTHPDRRDLIQRFARFFNTGGIPAVCLGLHLDQVPGQSCWTKLAKVLAGLETGAPEDEAIVLGYIKQAGPSLNVIFRTYEKEHAASAAAKA